MARWPGEVGEHRTALGLCGLRAPGGHRRSGGYSYSAADGVASGAVGAGRAAVHPAVFAAARRAAVAFSPAA